MSRLCHLLCDLKESNSTYMDLSFFICKIKGIELNDLLITSTYKITVAN